MSNLTNHPNYEHQNNIEIVDSHAHFWDLKQLDYPWLDQVPAIKQNFLTEDYQRQTDGIPINDIVFVQSDCRANQSLDEVDFVSNLSSIDPRIKAIVAHNPIDNVSKAEAELKELSKNSLVKGIRCMFDDSSRFLCTDSIQVLRMLPDYNYSFDICIKFNDVPTVVKMIEQCPDTRFIVDHLAKPAIKDGQFEQFKVGLSQLAAFPNVSAKISGLITEAGADWTADDLEPYVSFSVEQFGFERLMFGSNWPVVLLNGTFKDWYSTIKNFMNSYSVEDNMQFFGRTARSVYCLD